MEHVGKPRTRAVVDVGFTTVNLGDHRQTTDKGGKGVADAHREKILVHVSLVAARIDLGDCVRTHQRIDTSDERKHHDVFDADHREYAGEIWECQRTKHIVGNVYEEARPERMVLPTE